MPTLPFTTVYLLLALQDPAAPQGPSVPSADDLADLERAIAADEQARAKQAGASPAAAPLPTPVVPRTIPLGGGFSMNPDISFILDVALAAFSQDDDLQTGAHDPTRNGFNLQQLELSIGSAVDPYFRFDSNIVFSQFGVEIEEAYATTLNLPASLQMRAGQFLTRFGRINPTHPHSWDFVDQPFQFGRVFGAEGNRGLGVEASWLTPLPWFVEVLASSTDAAGEATARTFYGAQDLGVYGPQDLLTTVAIKQFFPLSDDWSLMWGLSGAFGPNPTGYHNRTDVYGTDLYLKFRPVTRGSYAAAWLQAEWLYRRRQIPHDVLWDTGGYAQAVARYRRWAIAGRYEYGSPAHGDAPGADGVGVDYLDPAWTSHRHRVSANVTFWPTEFSRLRLQGSMDRPGWRDQPIWAVFLAAEFVVGAHGAHRF